MMIGWGEGGVRLWKVRIGRHWFGEGQATVGRLVGDGGLKG